jgi:hypothetical protein
MLKMCHQALRVVYHYTCWILKLEIVIIFHCVVMYFEAVKRHSKNR